MYRFPNAVPYTVLLWYTYELVYLISHPCLAVYYQGEVFSTLLAIFIHKQKKFKLLLFWSCSHSVRSISMINAVLYCYNYSAIIAKHHNSTYLLNSNIPVTENFLSLEIFTPAMMKTQLLIGDLFQTPTFFYQYPINKSSDRLFSSLFCSLDAQWIMQHAHFLNM